MYFISCLGVRKESITKRYMASPEPSNSISSRSEQPDTAEAKEIELKIAL